MHHAHSMILRRLSAGSTDDIENFINIGMKFYTNTPEKTYLLDIYANQLHRAMY
jgi:hypothetical protein